MPKKLTNALQVEDYPSNLFPSRPMTSHLRVIPTLQQFLSQKWLPTQLTMKLHSSNYKRNQGWDRLQITERLTLSQSNRT